MNNNLNMNQQCTAAAMKGNWILDSIYRDIILRYRDVIIPLCSALVRLHLENFVHIIQGRCKQMGKGPEEGNEDGQRAGE